MTCAQNVLQILRSALHAAAKRIPCCAAGFIVNSLWLFALAPAKVTSESSRLL